LDTRIPSWIQLGTELHSHKFVKSELAKGEGRSMIIKAIAGNRYSKTHVRTFAIILLMKTIQINPV
jgi:hypothetical protein